MYPKLRLAGRKEVTRIQGVIHRF